MKDFYRAKSDWMMTKSIEKNGKDRTSYFRLRCRKNCSLTLASWVNVSVRSNHMLHNVFLHMHFQYHRFQKAIVKKDGLSSILHQP